MPVLVEGPLDVLALTTRARTTGDADLLPVATCGTAVTGTQADLVGRIGQTRSVVVAMDGDNAGRSAALAAGEQLRRHGLGDS